MYILNGIAYAGTKEEDRQVSAVKPLDDWMLLLTFSSGERRLYDASGLLSLPAFLPLRDETVFKSASVDRGGVVWADGEIDLAPETMYAESYAYPDSVNL